ncbi:MAG: glycoside hydrolase family 31 protein [Spirochaetales bacterium]
MDFHKVETTSNFVFGPEEARTLKLTDHGSDVFRLQGSGKRWPRGTDSFATLTPEEFGATASKAQLTTGPGGEVTLKLGGVTLLESQPGRGLGVCGNKWVLAFPYNPEDRFYGLGEKNLGFELSGKRTKYWNTDVLGEFYFGQIENSSTDPFYGTSPVFIIKTKGHWVGIVVDNPHAPFVNTGATESIFQPGAGPFVPELFFGARDGSPDVWFACSDTPHGLVRKLQALQGRTPLPPLWALGHQQCRWGYKSYDDLKALADKYDELGIPNDGLWLDIDYMDGYRVFTIDGKHFPQPEAQLKALTDRGYRVVPILDPGFRRDPEYSVYAEAVKRNVLCQTPEGQEYIGYVWPGYTVFPDFSLGEGRAYWAEQVTALTKRGFSAYWIDMNDPSTGSVPHDDMRFGHEKLPHSTWHNQYALGMAVATREGLLKAHPNERPFVISRSSYLSQNRHSAVWTGDNISNEHHMRGTIALTLNFSVSGMPFNGPDVPGFAMDASNELMRAWYKLGFLFPFFRNHKIAGATDQEPWTRDPLTTRIVISYIRLRYKLLPYLYNLFVQQNEVGDPMLRPVWYHDPSPAFDKTDDEFFVGPSLLQAPFVELAAKTREVRLPQHANGGLWFDVLAGKWLEAGTTIIHRNRPQTTPIFLASPSVLPLQKGLRTTHNNDLANLDLLVVLRPGTSVTTCYQFDDGLTLEHLKGRRSVYEIEARQLDEGSGSGVTLSVKALETGCGALKLRVLLLTPSPVNTLEVNRQPLGLAKETLDLAAGKFAVFASTELTL